MPRTLCLAPIVLLSLVGCVADESQMTARAATKNASARSDAERAFFARGFRPMTPAPLEKQLTLRGVNAGCTSESNRAATDSVDVLVGEVAGITTFQAACALASGRQPRLSVHLAGEAAETLLTSIPRGSAFAVATSGKVTRYLVVGHVTKLERGFAKGVSCCCDSPPPMMNDATFHVVVGAYPATDEVVISYDVVAVDFCDPAAPQ
ncbi:hypothetical protein BH09MYX1_BH09MYX1_26160 [soil metagenome]